ncbi:MAG: DUF1501 domain-containing protein [Anaerolineales bacterium]|nr:DUF1501 domain-containing protein [Anaerolineales bacterium]
MNGARHRAAERPAFRLAGAASGHPRYRQPLAAAGGDGGRNGRPLAARANPHHRPALYCRFSSGRRGHSSGRDASRPGPAVQPGRSAGPAGGGGDGNAGGSQGAGPLKIPAASGAVYPDDEFGLGLRQVALLVKAQAGLEVACLDVGGWDTHFAQGGSEGLMAGLLQSLAAGLQAFYLDLSEQADQLLVVVMSEFGRRLRENGSLGTDHGHGGAMLLLGGNVAGGRLHGVWPGLAPEYLAGPGDLAITTDYRDILGEIILKRLNNPHLAEIFPGYTPQFREVIRSR